MVGSVKRLVAQLKKAYTHLQLGINIIKLVYTLKRLYDTIVIGWPDENIVDERILLYYALRSELVMDDDLIFKVFQLVIPR